MCCNTLNGVLQLGPHCSKSTCTISHSKFHCPIHVCLELLPCLLLPALYIYSFPSFGAVLIRFIVFFHLLACPTHPYKCTSVVCGLCVSFTDSLTLPCHCPAGVCADRSEKVIVCHRLPQVLAYHSRCAPTSIPHMVSDPESPRTKSCCGLHAAQASLIWLSSIG